MTFTPLKIEIHLKNSVAMQKNKAAFDAILAMLYFNQQKNACTFNGDYAQQLDFLAQTDGVYHTSFPQFVGVPPNLAVFYYNPSEVVIEKAIEWFGEDNVKRI